MKTVIGIDVGGTTTKIVGFNQGELIEPLFVKSGDPSPLFTVRSANLHTKTPSPYPISAG